MDWNMELVVVVAAITTLQITPGLFEPTWRAIERKFVNRFEQNWADCGHVINDIVREGLNKKNVFFRALSE